MTATDTTPALDGPAAPPIPRDRWHRPLVAPPEGGKPRAYTRCTTYVDCLDDKYNLQVWQQRMVALGLADRPDLLLAVSAHRDDKKHLNTLTEQAREAAAAGAAATTGTALHALTERLDRDQPLGAVPDTYRADLDAYRAATEGTVEPLLIEAFTVHDELMIGGTPDRVLRYGQCGYIGDIKTGSIDYSAGKIAMQLAVYARSMPYDHVTQTRSPYPVEVNTQWGLVIHLPAGTGTCELRWIDLDAGWRGVQLATQVRAFRRDTKPFTPFIAGYSPPSPCADEGRDQSSSDRDSTTVAAALDAITDARTVQELRGVYTRFVTAGADPDAILPACHTRKTELNNNQKTPTNKGEP